MFNFVGVAGSVRVDTSHADSFGSTSDTTLGGMNVVAGTIETSDDEHGGNALESDDHVFRFVDFARSLLVLVEVTHRPAERTCFRSDFLVQLLASVNLCLLVVDGGFLGFGLGEGLDLGGGGSLLIGDGKLIDDGALAGLVVVYLIVVLVHSVVGHQSECGTLDWSALEKKRTLDDVVPLDRGVAADHTHVQEGNEEDGRQNGQTTTSSHGDAGNEVRWFRIELEVWRALVHDRERADRSRNQEEEWSSVDRPWDRVFAHVDHDLDQHEDDRTESRGDGGSHAQAREDGPESATVVPSPLHIGCAGSGNTHASNG